VIWNAVIKVLIYVFEEFGDDIVKSTQNPIDDVALKALLGVLKTLK
jgi:hypothetical protein